MCGPAVGLCDVPAQEVGVSIKKNGSTRADRALSRDAEIKMVEVNFIVIFLSEATSHLLMCIAGKYAQRYNNTVSLTFNIFSTRKFDALFLPEMAWIA